MNEQPEFCGITKTLEVIGGKWTALIIRDLLNGPCRFSQLEDSLEGISPRTLAGRLKELEADQIITRDCTTGHPVYALTPKGYSLHRIIDQMRLWGEATV